MKILLKITGTMERYFPATEYHLSLEKEATLADLYEELANVAGAEISPAVWNNKKRRPRGPVVMRSEAGVLKDESHPLHEGQILEFKRFLVGG
jgi:hypothetical protein